MKVFQFPLTKITIFFIIGILVSFYLNCNTQNAFALLFICVIGFCGVFYYFKNNRVKTIFFGIATGILSFTIGVFTQVVHKESNHKDNYIHLISDSKIHQVEIVLREKLKSSKYNDRYIAVVKTFDQTACSGKILINLHKDKNNYKYRIGSNLQIQGSILKHKKPNNPDQFDYGKYLTNKSILSQMYVDSDQLKISSKIDKNGWYYSDLIRTKIISNLQKANFKKEELAVISALILGQQQDISPEILHDYQFAGAIHILSVSGLHVGFILLFITSLLKPLPKNKWGNFLRLLFIILSLWVFALIAGLSPSVVRSVTMFSFVAIGMNLKRSTNVFHTLLVSIYLILLFQPSFLFDIGFQLSYLALFFILWLQPLLSKLWQPKNKIAVYFWDILTVSFAAQIGALPLSIYYFHQFPGLFFVTNLIIIPFLSLIMALGVFVMILALFNYVPQFPMKIVEFSIQILNKIINWVASFEQFIIQDIPFNWYMLVSLYILIITVIVWFKRSNFNTLAFTLISVILFQATCFITLWINQNQKEWIVFNSRENTLITERDGENTRVFCSDSLLTKTNNNFSLKPYLVSNFSSVQKTEKLPTLFYFNDQKIIIVDSLGIYPSNIKPDIIVVTQSPKINFDRLILALKPKLIVADASNYKTYLARWKATCIKHKIPFHATSEKGFYRIIE